MLESPRKAYVLLGVEPELDCWDGATALKALQGAELVISLSPYAGLAGKTQVQMMVRKLLRLPGDPSPDAADALACAICHAHGGLGYGGVGIGQRRRRGRLG